MEKYRKEIDKIDGKIRDLLLQRLELVREIGEYKKENNIGILDEAREEDILNRLSDSLSIEEEKYIRNIYGGIFKSSKDIESSR